jgi:hypothetical protein
MNSALKLAAPYLALGDLHSLSRVCRAWRRWVRCSVSIPALCQRQLGVAVQGEEWGDLYRQLAAAGCFVLQRRKKTFRSSKTIVYHQVRHRWQASGLPHRRRNMVVCVRKRSGRVDILRCASRHWKRNVPGVVWHLTT